MWDDFMRELRAEHVGLAPGEGPPSHPTVRERLQAAYEGVMARKAAASEQVA